jgi:dCTP deaminase
MYTSFQRGPTLHCRRCIDDIGHSPVRNRPVPPTSRRRCSTSGGRARPNPLANVVVVVASLTWAVVILSDRTIREQLAAGRIVIEPLDETLIQPSSIDVRISNLFRVFRNHTRGVIDVKHDMVDLTELVELTEGSDEPFMLHPGEFVLGSTLERIAVPDDLVGRVEGKSSLGRLGLLIHSTAGFIDAGFDGHITLELANVASLPITLYPGMKIGQVSFMQMTTPAEHPYGSGAEGSKYQGQRGPTPSRYFENFQR